MAVNVSAKTVGLVVAAAILGTWFGNTLTQNVAREQAARVPRGVRAVGTSTPVPRAEKLRERLPQAPLPERGRNPFVFGPRVSPRPALRDRADEGVAPA